MAFYILKEKELLFNTFFLVGYVDETDMKNTQCNLDLVTLLVPAKTVTKLHNVTKSNDFMQ